MLSTTDLLIYLARKVPLYKETELSTTLIAKDTNSSQQTISRKLIELQELEFINRSPTNRGIRISFTKHGVENLKKLYSELKEIFSEKLTSFPGTVESGFGEGAYYVSLKGYTDQFREKLGIVPYKGTLNLRVDYAKFLQFITSQEKILIDGFKSSNRTFGPIVAYKIKIKDIDAAIIIPERTSHERDIIEIISSYYLRQKFDLKDKSEVKIKIR